MRKIAKKILGSPLKILGFVAIIYGMLLLLVVLCGFDSLVGRMLLFIGGGIVFYLLDFIISKRTKNNRSFFLAQLGVIIIVAILISLIKYLYDLKESANTTIVFNHKDRKEGVIIFGIQGYPPLPKAWLWQTIVMPDNGILITSSSRDELPGYRTIIKKNGKIMDQYGDFIYQPCVINDNILMAYYISGEECKCNYQIMPRKNTRIQDRYYAIYDSLALGLLNTNLKTPNFKKVIFNDSNGLYFDSRNLTKYWNGALPDCIGQFKFYKAIFRESEIYAIPTPILHNPNITELYMNDSRLDRIDSAISQMVNLRVLDVSSTPVDEFPESLVHLKHLKILNIRNIPNESEKLKHLKKMLPKVTIIHN